MNTPRGPRTPLQEYAINIMMTPPPKTPFVEDDGSFCSFPFSLPFKTRSTRESDTQSKEISKLKLENHQLNMKIKTLTEDVEYFKTQFEEFQYAVVESVSDLEIGFEKKRIYDFQLFQTLIEQKHLLVNTPPLPARIESKVTSKSRDLIDSSVIFALFVLLLSIILLLF
jgi:hypothetical protein